MAKTKHNHLLDTIDEVVSDAQRQGLIHLYTDDQTHLGNTVKIKGKEMRYFGTTGYLGLGYDNRLKEGSIDAIRKYGTQFPLSKTYLSTNIYAELEEKLYRMYNQPVLISKNSTLTHLAVIPSVVRDEDAVILDHQVHYSVQTACSLLKVRGIPVDMIRHNNLDMLEEKLKELKSKHQKIWYMIDSVYSMFGDYAPLKELAILIEKYDQLYLYVDDVHGMSWTGKNGTGYALTQFEKLPEKVILVSTLGKSFGASGGFMVCADKELSRYVKTYGGPLTFSAQLEPSSVGAALASATIHLTDEIYTMQEELKQRIDYCNQLIKKTNLPLVKSSETPIFFIGTGLPSAGYNLSKRIMDEGFYINLGIFPAVPVRNTGIRFTLSRLNNFEDIKRLIEVIDYHYPQMLEEEEKTQNEIRKIFKLPLLEIKEKERKTDSLFSIQHKKSIHDISSDTWNDFFGDSPNFDYDGMQFLEKTFKNNELIESNSNFDYIFINDAKTNQPIVATFTTTTLWKEDMLSNPQISKKIEEKRKMDPYYLTTRVVSTGSIITEGDHIWINKAHPHWQEALIKLIDIMNDIEDKENASMIVLRDFNANDLEIKNLLLEKGFLKIDMPDSCVMEDIKWNSMDEFLLSKIPYKYRNRFRSEVIKYENFFDIEIKNEITEEECDYFYKLYQNVSSRNLDINIFDYPINLIKSMINDPHWEFIILKIKPEYMDTPITKFENIASVIFNYKDKNENYCPVIIGMDYQFLEKYKIYRQSLYQIIKRAHSLQKNKIYFGFSASLEKKKVGATSIPKVAYIQAKDNFNLEVIESMSAQ